MKKYISIAAILAAGTVFANAAATVLTFDQTEYTFDTDKWALNGLGNGPGAAWSGSETLDDGTVAGLSITGGKFWDYATDTASWTNTVALTDMNQNLGTSITADNITEIKIDATAAQGSKSTLTLDFSNNTGINTADEVIFYLLVATSKDGNNTAIYSNFTVAGLTDAVISWATADGSGYTDNSVTAVTLPVNNLGLIKVEGTLGAETVTFAADAAKNGWAMVAYNAIPEPSAFGLLAGLGALALVGARRRRK